MAASQQNFFTQTGLGSISPGAIVGDDSEDPFQAILFTSGDYLLTNALEQGSPGEASGCAAVAVELWLRCVSDSTPAVEMNLACGPQPASGTRQYQLKLGTDGKVSFGLHGAGGTQIVTSTTVLSPDVWYHIVGAVDAGHQTLYINSAVEGDAVWADTIITGFHSDPTLANMQLGDSGASGISIHIDEFAFYRLGMTPASVLAHYQAGALRGFTHHSSNVRMGAVLDAISSTAPRRFGTGAREVIALYMRGQDALSTMRDALSAEAVDCALFVDRSGSIVFLQSGHRSASPYDTIQATFGDGGGSELPYLDFELDYSESFLANEWSVTRSAPNAQTQTATDATSIAVYLKRPQSLTGLPVVDDTASATIASALLAKYKDPMQRIISIAPDMSDPTTADTVYGLELMDKIRVIRRPPGGGSAIQQDVFIQKIEHSGANDGHPSTCKIGVSPL